MCEKNGNGRNTQSDFTAGGGIAEERVIKLAWTPGGQALESFNLLGIPILKRGEGGLKGGSGLTSSCYYYEAQGVR